MYTKTRRHFFILSSLAQVVSLLLSAGADASAVDLARLLASASASASAYGKCNHSLELMAAMKSASCCCRSPFSMSTNNPKPLTKSCRCCWIQITMLQQHVRGQRLRLGCGHHDSDEGSCCVRDGNDDASAAQAVLGAATGCFICFIFPTQRAYTKMNFRAKSSLSPLISTPNPPPSRCARHHFPPPLRSSCSHRLIALRSNKKRTKERFKRKQLTVPLLWLQQRRRH